MRLPLLIHSPQKTNTVYFNNNGTTIVKLVTPLLNSYVMNTIKQPKCATKCINCYYNQLNKCIAQAGDDFFIDIDIEKESSKKIKKLQKNLITEIEMHFEITGKRNIAF